MDDFEELDQFKGGTGSFPSALPRKKKHSGNLTLKRKRLTQSAVVNLYALLCKQIQSPVHQTLCKEIGSVKCGRLSVEGNLKNL